MTKPRSEQVSLEDTPFYHCMVRCVRRAFLCGEDSVTGENFDHRRQWLVSRLRFLSYIYSIDICAYAIMSNHYHVVLHVDKAQAQGWSLEEVVERWLQLYSGDLLVHRWLSEKHNLSPGQIEKAEEIIELWRERLCSISWFMRGVNETIARMANEEDNCKGRFWEGRFKSQALLDEGALLTCMAYVDLNPVRAAMAEDLVESDFTSIQQRLFEFAQQQQAQKKLKTTRKLQQRIEYQNNIKDSLDLCDLPEAPLKPLGGSYQIGIENALPITQEDYFDLVDATGRCIRQDKRGSISQNTAKIINQFGIDPDQWLEHVKNFSRRYGDSAGSKESLQRHAERHHKCWRKGVLNSSRVYACAI